MSFKTDTWAHQAETLIRKLKERGMDAVYYATGAEAREAILNNGF